MVTKAQYLDPVQFGRWVSERRRALGWPSQRALADATEHDPVTRESGITESFLARLEAGVLAWPPRGGVRHRVIELAWFLCDTPRAVASYLQLAGCSRPTDDERALIARITSYISASTADVPVLLPPQPPRLIGRGAEVSALLEQLLALDGGCYAVTGMLGAGKSAIAAEAVHLLARDRRQRAYYFPDGIISLSAKHRHGLNGLLDVLSEICAVCTRDPDTIDMKRNARWRPRLVVSARADADNVLGDGEQGVQGVQGDAVPTSASDLAAAINRTRYALAGKRLLLLLDDLDPRFPLPEALDALLASGALQGQHDEDMPSQRITVLITSRAVVDSPLVKARLQVAPLDEPSSLALFGELVGRPLDEPERVAAASLCAGLAHLPFAIELAASSVRVDGIPVELLARLVEQHPLDLSWHGGEILREQLADAVAALRPEARTTLALLPLLGTRTFTLRTAASLKGSITPVGTKPALPAAQAVSASGRGGAGERVTEGAGKSCLPTHEGSDHTISLSLPGPHDTSAETLVPVDADGDSATTLAYAAATLGQLVRNSLLDVVPSSAGGDETKQSNRHPAPDDRHPRYQISPLLQAYALEELSMLDPEQRERAYRNVHAYALDLVERISPGPQKLAHEWPIVMTAFTRSLHAGHEQQMLDLVDAVSHRPLLMLRFQEQTRLILDAGISAYRRADNRLALMHLLSRLGVFLYYQGSLDDARRVWTESAQIAESLPLSCGPYFPHYNLAVFSTHTGAYSAAQKFLDHVMASAVASAHNPELAYTYSARAEVFHRQGAIDSALANLAMAEERLVESAKSEEWDEASLDSMVQHFRLERARILGRYAQARDLADAMSRPTEPSIAAAQIALDQATYATRKGILDEARWFAQRAAQFGKELRAGFYLTTAQTLLDRLDELGDSGC